MLLFIIGKRLTKMKNLDAKKIAIIVAILIVVALIVVLVLKNGNKQTEATAEETTKLEEITNNYITEMKLGYATEYLGKEKLYSKQECKSKNKWWLRFRKSKYYKCNQLL